MREGKKVSKQEAAEQDARVICFGKPPIASKLLLGYGYIQLAEGRVKKETPAEEKTDA